jgi:uncharacterized membrane protein YidH (DUF202 family)
LSLSFSLFEVFPAQVCAKSARLRGKKGYVVAVNRTVVGIILIVIGIVLRGIGIKGYQKQEDVFRAGDFFNVTATTTKTVPALKYVGSGVIGAGAVLLILSFTGRK